MPTGALSVPSGDANLAEVGQQRYVPTNTTRRRRRGKAAMVLADQQRKNRADLVASRTTEDGPLLNRTQ